jgi:phage baseplate assembly protein W
VPAYRYKDFSLSFKPHPLTGDVVRVYDKDAVNQSLKNIILTERGEIPFSDRGSNIKSKLFELMTPETSREIKEDILSAILAYEPRVIVDDVIITELPQENSISVSIVYRIRTLDELITFTIFLKRA